MSFVKLTKYDQTCDLEFSPGESLYSILKKNGEKIPGNCNGKGRCAICYIKIIHGALPPLEREKEVVPAELLDSGIRLACLAQAREGMVVELSEAGYGFQWQEVELKQVNFDSVYKYAVTERPGERFGLAIDAGTSFVRMLLWDFSQDKPLRLISARNPQVAFGDDILSRLMVAAESPQRCKEISDILVNSLALAVEKIMSGYGTSREIGRVVVAGNAAMTRIFSCDNPGELLEIENFFTQKVPDEKVDSFYMYSGYKNKNDLFYKKLKRKWALSIDVEIRVLPSLSGFVGSDLLCGLAAVNLEERPSGNLYIDFGTNTEIALVCGNGNEGRILVTSAPGGPAFEGSGLICGMAAIPGGIRHATLDGDDLYLDVIGNGIPRGLTGTGVIDLLAILLKKGIIGKNGRFMEGRDSFSISSLGDPVSLIGPDIDQVQRAKASIAACIEELFTRASMPMEDVREIIVAGTFGAGLNVANAVSIGLLPAAARKKTGFHEGTVLAGAVMFLRGSQSDFLENIRGRLYMINMAVSPEYEKRFIRNLDFREMPDNNLE